MNLGIFSLILIVTLIAVNFTSCNRPAQMGDKEKTPVEKVNDPQKEYDENLKKHLESKETQANQVMQTNEYHKNQNTDSSGNLDFLKTLAGKYPYEVQLFDNPVFAQRLQKLLGERFDFLKSIWETQTPIEINNDLFYAWAMKAHSGGDPSAVLMFSFNSNVLFAGIRENGEEQFYSEDGSDVPQRLKDWADEQ